MNYKPVFKCETASCIIKPQLDPKYWESTPNKYPIHIQNKTFEGSEPNLKGTSEWTWLLFKQLVPKFLVFFHSRLCNTRYIWLACPLGIELVSNGCIFAVDPSMGYTSMLTLFLGCWPMKHNAFPPGTGGVLQGIKKYSPEYCWWRSYLNSLYVHFTKEFWKCIVFCKILELHVLLLPRARISAEIAFLFSISLKGEK